MNYFNVGKIVNTQGLQGEMRVLSVTDFAEERFKKVADESLGMKSAWINEWTPLDKR